MKAGNLNFLELSGPLQASNGRAVPYLFTVIYLREIMLLARQEFSLAKSTQTRKRLNGGSANRERSTKRNMIANIAYRCGQFEATN